MTAFDYLYLAAVVLALTYEYIKAKIQLEHAKLRLGEQNRWNQR